VVFYYLIESSLYPHTTGLCFSPGVSPVSKRPVSKRQVYKTSGFKTSGFKMNGLIENLSQVETTIDSVFWKVFICL
jgi:hypothetical protein